MRKAEHALDPGGRQTQDMQNEDLGRFLDRLVHDLREPLRSIGAFAEVLRENAAPHLVPEDHAVISEIVSGSERMRVLIESLARYSLALTPPTGHEQASLRLAIELAKAELASEIAHSGATVAADNLLELPVGLERLTQLMRDLISNALRFRGEAAPVIRISAIEADEGIVVSIEDNGIGIAPQDRERVFQPFVRVHGRKYPGAGMGLTVARTIVENRGGTIRIEAGKDDGAILIFTLPAT